MLYLKKLNQILQSKIFLILFGIIILIYIFFNNNKSIIDINSKKFKGIIESYKIDGDKLTLQVKNKERIIANYYIKIKKEKEYLVNNLKLGYEIELTGSFEEPVGNTIPNTFNYKKYLKSKEIYLIMNTKEYKIYKNNNIFYKLKNKLIDSINKRDNKDYYLMFILGDKEDIDPNIYNSYKINGITHLFAISGMHISMLILILKKIKLKDSLISLFLYLYSFLVMFTPSVLRVTVFYTLKNLKIFNNIANTILLYYVAGILILFNPNIIYDVGFQYSFVITLGLFIFKPKGIINLSILAFILSLPITLYNNYEFNLLSILINILIVPVVANFLYPFLLLSYIFSFLEPILSLMINILENINLFFNNFAINILIGKNNIIFVVLYYLVLYLFYKLKDRKLLVLLLISILITKYKSLFDNNYYVYYLDVGQGDSSVIITPKSKEVIMIDTGGKISYQKESWQEKEHLNNYSDNLILFFKRLGISKVDKLILTHGDYDHMGEAINLVNNFKVEKVIFNCGEFNVLEKELIKVLDKKKIPYFSCIKELNIDDNKLYFLNNKDYGNENDNSSVIYTELNNYKFLFMGDAGIEVEEELIKKYNLQDIDVLKVGHHGSKTSSSKSFIDEINPKYSIISVGKNNRYGHPNDSVLDILGDSEIYRTDKDGSILFKVKNNKLQIAICPP